MLSNFHVRGFRTFEDLDIPRLGRVNLIVGRNNVGKTMLLQALRVFQSQGSRDTILEILRDRDEFPRRVDDKHPSDYPSSVYEQPLDLASLFHGRATRTARPSEIILESRGAAPSEVRIGIIGDDPINLGVYFDNKPRWITEIDDNYVYVPSQISRTVSRSDGLIHPLLATGSLDVDLLGAWWDKVSLTDAESRVVDCLHIISDIERIALIDNPFSRSRITMVKLAGQADPVPLKSLGDGVGRMFAMALALEIARASKMLLIDEIENGIHYSILPDFWSFLFKAAAQSDVQIFATSHSWDCIEAFQQAASQDTGSGVLVKLAEHNGKITSTVFDDEELQIATRDGIELR